MRRLAGRATIDRVHLRSTWLTARDAVLDLLYPPCCGGCGRHGAGWLCPECLGRVSRLGTESRRDLLLAESAVPALTLTAISAAEFEPPLREAIHAFKYDGTPQLAGAFGALMAETWRDNNLRADAIVPVPLHASRLRERGYNQSELLARTMSQACALPAYPAALQRVRRTEQQAHLDAVARRANVQDAFRADRARVSGRRILLIDDVLTTGATLGECAAALYRAGAHTVLALTLARAHA
jgi:ComF family protein